MIKRRRRNRGDQRCSVAVELIVPPSRDGVTKVMPFKARQRGARLVGGTIFTSLGLRDPRLSQLGLRPQASRVPFDTTLGVTLVDQTPGDLVAVAQCRREQFGARTP